MQTSFEAFWNPVTHELAISCPGLDIEADAHTLDYAVFTGATEDDEGLLVSVIQQQREPHLVAIRLPHDHRYVSVLPASGRARAGKVCFQLVDELEIPDAIHCAAIAQTRSRTDLIEIQKLHDLSLQEPFLKSLSRTYGEHLVSVISHRRSADDRSGRPLLVGPSRLIWPLNNRVQIEPLSVGDAGQRREPPGPAAVQQYMVTENPPRARLRLYLNGGASSGKFTHARLSLVHILHQRRLFERLNQLRSQSRSRTQVEALSLHDIRDWLGDVHIAAVESDESIVVVNLGARLEAAGDPDPEIVVTVGRGGTYLDVEFCCAAIGDDVGIASTLATEGDFLVTPLDPGGDPKIRLFRLQRDRLEPRVTESTDKVFRDILTRVSLAEIGFKSQGQPIAADGEPWAELLERVGLPSTSDRLRMLQSNPIGALLLTAWSRLPHGHRPDPQTAESRFNDYRLTPAFVSALAWFPRLSEGADHASAPLARSDADLTRQIASALGASEVLEVPVTRETWSDVWRLITEPSLIQRLIEARISIDGHPIDVRRVREATEELHDKRRVRLALECCIDREMSEEADALEAYLENRDRDIWTPMSALVDLRKIIRELVEDPIYLEEQDAEAQLETTDVRSFDEMRAAIRRMITEAEKTPPVNAAVKAIAKDFDQRLKSKRLDRRLLRQFEQRLIKIVGLPGVDNLAKELTDNLETWADLPSFAERIKPRFRLLSGKSPRKQDIIEALINRVRVPAPGTGGYEFDQCRKRLSTLVHEKFATANSKVAPDLKELAEDVAGYADILLHHRAWMALSRLSQTSRSAEEAAETQRFERSMRVWPLRAAETWDIAKGIAAALPGESEKLGAALAPPDL